MEVALATVAAYSAWIVAFLPTTLPELAMGFVFGLRDGYIIDLAGKFLGCAVSYALGRTVLRACMHRLLSGHSLLRTFEDEAQTRPWRTSLVLRAAYVPMPVKNLQKSLLSRLETVCNL